MDIVPAVAALLHFFFLRICMHFCMFAIASLGKGRCTFFDDLFACVYLRLCNAFVA